MAASQGFFPKRSRKSSVSSEDGGIYDTPRCKAIDVDPHFHNSQVQFSTSEFFLCQSLRHEMFEMLLVPLKLQSLSNWKEQQVASGNEMYFITERLGFISHHWRVPEQHGPPQRGFPWIRVQSANGPKHSLWFTTNDVSHKPGSKNSKFWRMWLCINGSHTLFDCWRSFGWNERRSAKLHTQKPNHSVKHWTHV